MMPKSAVLTVSISVIALLVGAASSALAARRAAYERIMQAVDFQTALLRAQTQCSRDALSCQALRRGPEAATSMSSRMYRRHLLDDIDARVRGRDVVVSLLEV